MNNSKIFLSLLFSLVFSISSFAQTLEMEPNNTVNESGIKYITGTGVYHGGLTTQGDGDIWYIPFGSSGTISITFDVAGSGDGAYLQYYAKTSYYDFAAASYKGSINHEATENITLSSNSYYFFVIRGDGASALGGWQFTVNSVATIVGGVVFTNGSSFTPSIIAGNSNQVIGQFNLEENIETVKLTDATIKLNGTRTGLSNFKLWTSTDDAFDSGTDTQLGVTVSADPGDGNTISFNSF